EQCNQPIGARLVLLADAVFRTRHRWESGALSKQKYLLHIPVENEHLFRFKMNADSGLRVHHFRTPQSTNSDVR
ncbi:hypothetical protein, partial [Aeromonas caviae]|uniref:hypothetical protein n=1 Tax=Aeromonas caviae TaxID=648 RepID=UPI001CC6FD1D